MSEDIKFEQGCILYNIGALHSILGALDNRQSSDVSYFNLEIACNIYSYILLLSGHESFMHSFSMCCLGISKSKGLLWVKSQSRYRS
jgi:tyrosine-protein phosphatase non-receptor type 23